MTVSKYLIDTLFFLYLNSGAISIKKNSSDIEISSMYFSGVTNNITGICILIEGENVRSKCSNYLAQCCFFTPSSASELTGHFCYQKVTSAHVSDSNIAMCSPYPYSSEDRRRVLNFHNKESSVLEGLNISHCNAKHQMISVYGSDSNLTGCTISGCIVNLELFVIGHGKHQWSRFNMVSCTSGVRLCYIGSSTLNMNECCFVSTSGKIEAYNSTASVTNSFKSSSTITASSGVSFSWTGSFFENVHQSPKQLVKKIVDQCASSKYHRSEKLILLYLSCVSFLSFDVFKCRYL